MNATPAWPAMEPPRRLSRGEIHICKFNLQADEARLERFWQALSAQERARAGRFRSPEDRRRFVCAHAQLRGLLAGYLACAPADLEFSTAQYGKPFLSYPRTDTPLSFNLSHSGELALAACAWETPLGVDIERIRPVADVQRLARQTLSPDEYVDWGLVAPEHSLQVFYSAWTRKEALLKAAGEGLSLPLQGLRVSILPGQPAQLLAWDHPPGGRTDWVLYALHPETGYAAALAVAANGGRHSMLVFTGIS